MPRTAFASCTTEPASAMRSSAAAGQHAEVRVSSGAMLWAVLGAAVGNGGAMTVDTAPPVVVKTVPEAGTVGVDAKTTEIRVTFSKPMANGSWSWNRVPGALF